MILHYLPNIIFFIIVIVFLFAMLSLIFFTKVKPYQQEEVRKRIAFSKERARQFAKDIVELNQEIEAAKKENEIKNLIEQDSFLNAKHRSAYR